MTTTSRLFRSVAVLVLGAALGHGAAQAGTGAPDATLDIPINQTVMRGGALRYSVWVKVGDRSVEALLDTGSTGLRVLPAVVPGDLTGLPLEAPFATGETMKGLAITKQVQIGSLSAAIPIEVIDGMGCRPDRPRCAFARANGDALIGGDGSTGHGFSAILGIGFTEKDRDLPNPLETFGVTQWIISLPGADDPNPGHLVLSPPAARQAAFKMHPKVGSGDLFGCLRGTTPDQEVCGTVAFDTGGPYVLAVTAGNDPETSWAAGTDASLRLQGEPSLKFRVGDAGPATIVKVLPYRMRFKKEAPFINAGVYPYLFYDVLYDAAARKVGLRAREPHAVQVSQVAAVDEAKAARLSAEPAQARPQCRRRAIRASALR